MLREAGGRFGMGVGRGGSGGGGTERWCGVVTTKN